MPPPLFVPSVIAILEMNLPSVALGEDAHGGDVLGDRSGNPLREHTLHPRDCALYLTLIVS